MNTLWPQNVWKSAKENQILTYYKTEIFAIEIESITNSKPLSYVDDNPNCSLKVQIKQKHNDVLVLTSITTSLNNTWTICMQIWKIYWSILQTIWARVNS